ncbi:YqcC family protein [Photobacterium kishitanii]|uniref:YqcC family protein n=1 Tax=Photobacterium kishitanii TaxID=318456 RepID=UPI0004366D71|nr:YqcC family protein [Photobacterium kishitanii]KJG07025.1 pseudouridine synthase [Photobacterium kishitanii]OBU30205.1 pseudouridine synthase [Photobacterium kishitanii]PSU19660.1 YqcC family protein [Photobacterium kishitanii]PSV04004.1 YqcC family protein [Photobacterium kishitanii]PSV13090.1 YqcC family protein [Photobacterium kishitanii]
MDKYHQSQQLLTQLENILQQHQYWEMITPDPQALASTEPFAIDSLACHQWLQWIFIPKLRYLILQRLPLPTQFVISPYVEEAMKNQVGVEDIVVTVRAIDQLLNIK